MAKATKIEAVTEVVVVQPAGIRLDLSKQEADTLISLLGECGAFGPTSAIYDALKAVGAKKSHTVHEGYSGDRVKPLILKEV